MTEATMRYGMYYDELRGELVIEKHGEDWTPREYDLEITEAEVAEHVYLGRWISRKPNRFSRRDQSFPRLMALMIRASETGKVRI